MSICGRLILSRHNLFPLFIQATLSDPDISHLPVQAFKVHRQELYQ